MYRCTLAFLLVLISHLTRRICVETEPYYPYHQLDLSLFERAVQATFVETRSFDERYC
jgi:hypothetical protein